MDERDLRRLPALKEEALLEHYVVAARTDAHTVRAVKPTDFQPVLLSLFRAYFR